MASRLEAFDILGSTGPEAEKGKSRFVRAVVGGKESTVSEGTQMSVEILKQLTDLKGIMNSYRRELDKQHQELRRLKRSHYPYSQGN